MNYNTNKIYNNNNKYIATNIVSLCFNNNINDAQIQITNALNKVELNFYINYTELKLENIFRKLYQMKKINYDNNYYTNFTFLIKEFNIQQQKFKPRCGIL